MLFGDNLHTVDPTFMKANTIQKFIKYSHAQRFIRYPTGNVIFSGDKNLYPGYVIQIEIRCCYFFSYYIGRIHNTIQHKKEKQKKAQKVVLSLKAITAG